MIITVHGNSHSSLSYLPFLISTMQISGAHTGFLGILLWFKLIVMYLKHTVYSRVKKIQWGEMIKKNAEKVKKSLISFSSSTKITNYILNIESEYSYFQHKNVLL